jgi:hypothetical protein
MTLGSDLLLFMFIYSDISTTRPLGITYLGDAKPVVSDNTRLVYSFAPSLEALSFAISHIACISS